MSVQVVAPRSRERRVLAGIVALVVAVGSAAVALGPRIGRASSHREAPLVAADPQIDVTDLYAFRSPDAPGTVTFVSNWIPFQEPAGGPNFYPWATNTRYDVNVSNDKDARPELIYRWTFKNHRRNPNSFIYNNGPVTSLDDTNLLLYQTYDLRRIKVGGSSTLLVDDAISVPSYVGAASMPDYESLVAEGINEFGSAGKTFSGQADDPFFLDLRVFDLLYGGPGFPEAGDDTLAGFNVSTLALQVPRGQLARNGDLDDQPSIGVWTTASRRSTQVNTEGGKLNYKGDWVQVSRLGQPLVNEVVIPIKDKDEFNATQPVDDDKFAGYVVDPELPELVEAVHGVPAPDTCPADNTSRCRTDLVQVFLTGIPGLNKIPGVEASEMLRLNMKTPVCEESCPENSRLGVIDGDNAGFPNGRRLYDDVIDIAIQVMEGELVGNPNNLGDGVNENELEFSATFPYVALPFAGSDADPHAALP